MCVCTLCLSPLNKDGKFIEHAVSSLGDEEIYTSSTLLFVWLNVVSEYVRERSVVLNPYAPDVF